MSAYYNEFEPFAAEWLRRLIARNLIAPGDVDERSIIDVSPDDLRCYEQCHFFAGIGGWSLALRLAGWPDDRPVWTGSCPCQPFSAAGKQRGSEDERHLWPAFFRLIRECRPPVVFGEQVAGAAGLAWLDHVCADLEESGYAVAAADMPACSVGAPHRRQRLWWVAYADTKRHNWSGARSTRRDELENGVDIGSVADADQGQRGWFADGEGRERAGQTARWKQGYGIAEPCSHDGRMAYADSKRRDRHRLLLLPEEEGRDTGEVPEAAWSGEAGSVGNASKPGLAQQRGERKPSCGQVAADARQAAFRGDASTPWRNLEWLPCSDGKARPTQPGLFPLAHGVSGRVGRLRAYGNAIVPQVAAEFISAVMGCRP